MEIASFTWQVPRNLCPHIHHTTQWFYLKRPKVKVALFGSLKSSFTDKPLSRQRKMHHNNLLALYLHTQSTSKASPLRGESEAFRLPTASSASTPGLSLSWVRTPWNVL